MKAVRQRTRSSSMLKRWTHFLVLLISLNSFAYGMDTQLDYGSFTKAYAELVHKVVPGVDAHVANTGEVRATTSDGTQFTIYLDHVYRDYLQDTARFEGIISEHIRGTIGSFSTASKLTPDRLIAVIRDDEYIRSSQAIVNNNPGQRIIFEPLVANLSILYAFDLPGITQFATTKEIDELNLNKVALKDLATFNLKRILDKPEVSFDRRLTFVQGGPYVSSLLLIDEFWSDARFKGLGDPIVYVPTRDLLLITFDKSKATTSYLDEQAADLMKNSAYPVSTAPILRHEGKWVPYAR